MVLHPERGADGSVKLLAMLTATYFFAGLSALSFAPLLPFIQEDVGGNKALLGLFTSCIYLGALVSGFPSGWMADRWGVRETLTVGMTVQGVALGLVVTQRSITGMLIFVLVAGLGYGSVNPTTSKGVIVWFSSRWRSTAMAIKQMGFTVGTMTAAATLPVIARLAGWRLAIVLVAAAITGFGLLSYAFFPPAPSAQTAVPRVDTPVALEKISVPTWKNGQILFLGVLGLFFASVQMSGTSYLSVYLVEKFAYSKVVAGMFLGVTQGAGMLGRLVWSRVSDLYFPDKRHREIILVGLIASAACIAFGLMPNTTSMVVVGVIAAVFGFTAIGYNALFLPLVGEMSGPEKAGEAIGACVTIAYLGVVIATPLFGLSIEHFGYDTSWLLAGALLLLVNLATAAYWNPQPRQLSEQSPCAVPPSAEA